MGGNNGQTALLTDSILNQPFGILGVPKSAPDPVIPLSKTYRGYVRAGAYADDKIAY